MPGRPPKGASGGGGKSKPQIGQAPGASVAPNYKVREVDYYPLSEEEIHEIGFLNDTAADYYAASTFWSGLTVALGLSYIFGADALSVVQATIVDVLSVISLILAAGAYRNGNRFKSRKLSKIDTYIKQATTPSIEGGVVVALPGVPALPPKPVTIGPRLLQWLLGTGPGTPR